ncbi:MAG: hypothetical protein HQL69_04440 [Magnetococcales bacterium]|nr:hypothetical protein [Magnetococcales bacterium]
MSTIVSNLTSPTLYQGGDPARNTPHPKVGQLAEDTKNLSNTSRPIDAHKVGEIKDVSRDPRTTPKYLERNTKENSKDAKEADVEDKISFTENSRIARNPEPVHPQGQVANLNIESKLASDGVQTLEPEPVENSGPPVIEEQSTNEVDITV